MSSTTTPLVPKTTHQSSLRDTGDPTGWRKPSPTTEWRLRSLRTGKVIPHLVNINKLKRAYCPGEDLEEEAV